MEKKYYEDITLLIQGSTKTKDNLTFLEHIDYYKSLFKKIVISTYTEDLTEELLNIIKIHNLILVDQTKNISIENKYNIGFQTLSTLAGLYECSTKYTLKHRTDEKYSNLNLLIDIFMEDTNKWVSGGTFFGAKSYHIFHAADHLFIGKTDKLIKTFETTLQNLYNGKYEKNANNEPAAEVTFTKNFIRISGEEPNLQYHDTQMLKYFNFISDKHLEPFLIRFNSKKEIYRTFKDFHPSFNFYENMNDILTKSGMIL